jgi:hypothetical protein
MAAGLLAFADPIKPIRSRRALTGDSRTTAESVGTST